MEPLEQDIPSEKSPLTGKSRASAGERVPSCPIQNKESWTESAGAQLHHRLCHTSKDLMPGAKSRESTEIREVGKKPNQQEDGLIRAERWFQTEAQWFRFSAVILRKQKSMRDEVGRAWSNGVLPAPSPPLPVQSFTWFEWNRPEEHWKYLTNKLRRCLSRHGGCRKEQSLDNGFRSLGRGHWV